MSHLLECAGMGQHIATRLLAWYKAAVVLSGNLLYDSRYPESIGIQLGRHRMSCATAAQVASRGPSTSRAGRSSLPGESANVGADEFEDRTQRTSPRGDRQPRLRDSISQSWGQTAAFSPWQNGGVLLTTRARLRAMASDATQGRLLVVDDDEVVRTIVVRLAEALGYEARGESRGTEFARAYDEFRPTAIVMDGYLGDVDLEDLVEQIASRNFDGKLVFISGAEDYLALAELHSERAGLKCRGLHKPFGTEELEAVLLAAPNNDGA